MIYKRNIKKPQLEVSPGKMAPVTPNSWSSSYIILSPMSVGWIYQRTAKNKTGQWSINHFHDSAQEMTDV